MAREGERESKCMPHTFPLSTASSALIQGQHKVILCFVFLPPFPREQTFPLGGFGQIRIPIFICLMCFYAPYLGTKGNTLPHPSELTVGILPRRENVVKMGPGFAKLNIWLVCKRFLLNTVGMKVNDQGVKDCGNRECGHFHRMRMYCVLLSHKVALLCDANPFPSSFFVLQDLRKQVAPLLKGFQAEVSAI